MEASDPVANYLVISKEAATPLKSRSSSTWGNRKVIRHDAHTGEQPFVKIFDNLLRSSRP
jgi:hypothetical protein